MFNKIYELDDNEVIMIMLEFTDEELEVISRYNKLVGDAVKARMLNK